MKVQEKLDIFYRKAVQSAEERRESILAEIRERTEESCREIREKTQREADARIEAERDKVTQHKNKEIFNASSEVKNTLLELRNQITDELFKSVAERLEKFINSGEYPTALIEDAASVSREYGGEFELQLCNRDMKHKTELEKIAGISVKQGDDSILGGFRAISHSRNIIIDKTYSSRLREARKSFTGFKIN